MFQPLLDFISSHADSADVFCFQEVSISDRVGTNEEKNRNNLRGDIARILPNYQSYHAAFQEGFNWKPTDSDIALGNVVFVRNGLEVAEHGSVFVHLEKNSLHFPDAAKHDWFTMPRLVQFVRLENGVTFFNFHGLWHTSGKGDIPERLEQSKKIKACMDRFEGKKILCGDFNLDIDSQSLKMLESDMQNLIKKFDIKTTRSKHYPKIDIMPFADYTLVSPEVEVQSFEVPYSEASDHLPMILEFN